YLIGVNQNALENFDGTLNEKALVETVAHEFGHTLQAHLFTKADPNTRNAIFNEYKEYLRSVFQDTKTVQDVLRKIDTPAVSNMETGKGRVESRAPGSDAYMQYVGVREGLAKDILCESERDYFLSSDEWFAQ